MKNDKNIEEKRTKKKLSREQCSSLFTLIVIVVTLGITLPLHFVFPNNFTTYWVITICIAVICPIALVDFKINVEAKGNYTDEQIKALTTKTGIAMLSIWYADFAFVCMFMNWLVSFFILAGLYFVKMVYNIAIILVNRKDSKTYPNFLIIGDFVLSFLLLILLIYKIPNETLQTIVIALTSALLGGLLTLLGVVMTIKKSDKDRMEDEIKKTKPVFSYNMVRKEPSLDVIVQKICMTDSLEEMNDGCSVCVELENSNLSSFEIKRIFHDGKWVITEGNTIVLPSSKCLLYFRFKDKPSALFMEVEDILGNTYYYHLLVLYIGTDRLFHTIREIKNISKEEMEKIMKEAK